VTLLVNGVLALDHVEVGSPLRGLARCNASPGPLLLQDHSGFPGAPRTVMKFRNIWLRPLGEPLKPLL
jgi:hypothetical protein